LFDAIRDGFKIVAQYWTEVESMASVSKILGFLVVGLLHSTPNEQPSAIDNTGDIKLL